MLAILFAILEAMMMHGLFRPGFLTLDEVHDNLDVEGWRSVQRLLKGFRARHPSHRIFIISHNESEMADKDGTIQVKPDVLGQGRAYLATLGSGEAVREFEG